MNHFLFILSFFCFSQVSHCWSESFKDLQSQEDYQDNLIVSPSETYSIIKKLGEGAFGEVFEVKDSQGRFFAIKVHKGAWNEEGVFSYYEDAEREFMRGQILDHPHIIKSYDFFTNQLNSGRETKNIVLQFVKGNPLSNVPRKSISKEETIRGVAQFCDAISYASTLNLLHLDLHEGNVMLSDQSDVMIIDLASFFTYDEILTFVRQYTKDNSTANSTKLQMEAIHPDGGRTGLTTKKARKIQEFFDAYPELFFHIQQQQKRNDTKIPEKFVTATQSENCQSSCLNIDLSPIDAHYFDRMTEICRSIIDKSTIAKEEKVNLEVEIKRIAWHYREDVEDRKCPSLSFYLNQLTQMIDGLNNSELEV